jgi:hypothetical protein
LLAATADARLLFYTSSGPIAATSKVVTGMGHTGAGFLHTGAGQSLVHSKERLHAEAPSSSQLLNASSWSLKASLFQPPICPNTAEHSDILRGGQRG